MSRKHKFSEMDFIANIHKLFLRVNEYYSEAISVNFRTLFYIAILQFLNLHIMGNA